MMAVMLLYPCRPIAELPINVMIVMLMGGLWHGAHMNFIVWGALNGAVLSVWIVLPLRSENAWSNWLGWLVTFHTVVASRIWFRAGSLVHWNESVGTPHPKTRGTPHKSSGTTLGQAAPNPIGNVHWQPTYLAGIVLLGIGFGLHFLPEPVSDAFAESGKKTTWMLWAGCCGATLLSTWAPGTQMRPFIYWQF